MTDGLRRVAPDSGLEEAVEILERDGALVVEDLADAGTLKALWDDLGPALDARDYSGDWYNGTRTRRVSSVFARTDRLTPVVTHPLFLGAARRIMQRPVHVWIGRSRTALVPTVQISGTQAIQIHQGQGKQPLHRDDALHLRRHPGPTSRVQLMLAMSDFTADNGGTLMIPGSHHWDDERPPRAEEAVPTEMRAGSGLVWLGGVYHGGGANTTDTPRTGLTIALDLGNLRQEENQYLAVPRESVLAYPEEVRRLLGYDRCPPGLGWYEMDDPYVLLADDGPGPRPAPVP
ncbi:phytanoyl-CoA dioxygenase [Streptomyces spongiicola]|uniref:Phytanoyl-CoA dioxygenase n=1 Tax=Streptomyces spongiicola TaxID=1690221 RepID=A0A2S1Z8E2_9ACTN|nr:phytanoyl-CoA dioxygenase family protein [Streptomyces spongiicola]AWK12600.1 phytanoyl-CoA dioxygenase [Streptomyces spongiicola]GBQ03523.1 phytanoyl-CoA dioxygenase [Streptomyces spongiicola]